MTDDASKAAKFESVLVCIDVASLTHGELQHPNGRVEGDFPTAELSRVTSYEVATKAFRESKSNLFVGLVMLISIDLVRADRQRRSAKLFFFAVRVQLAHPFGGRAEQVLCGRIGQSLLEREYR